MSYEFREWEDELEPEVSFGRTGGPPRKSIGIGVLEPPSPPRRPLGPLAGLPFSFVLRLLAGLILAGLRVLLLTLLFLRKQ
jgi:hypothetical protein